MKNSQNKHHNIDFNLFIYFFFAPIIVLISGKQSFYQGIYSKKEVIVLSLGNLFYSILILIVIFNN